MSKKREQRGVRWVVIVLVALASSAMASPSDASAQSLQQLQEEISFFGKRMNNLEQKFLKPEMMRAQYQLETRYNDAKVAYYLKDYSKASILLVDVVSRANPNTFSSFTEATYLLGDSLYHLRNFMASGKYFQKVIDSGGGEYYTPSIERMLDIADATGDYDKVDEYYKKLANSNPSAALDYNRARSLYKRGKFADSRRYFERAANSPEFSFKARYLLGVAYAADKKFDEAAKVYQSLVKQEASKPSDVYTRQMGYLALGRLSYEQGKYNEAIDYYQRMPRTHRHFDRALYEMTWTLVQLKKFKVAQQNVEILLSLTNPDPRLEANSRLLRADLASRNKDYNTAVEQYERVINTYQPLRAQMQKVAAEQADIDEFFKSIADEALSNPERANLPNLVRAWFKDSARHWLANSPKMSKSRYVVKDLDRALEDLNESDRILDQIEARLSSGTRVKVFPQLAEGMALAIELENQILNARSKLLEAEYDARQGSMTQSQRATWKQKRAAYEALRKRYASVPQTAKAVQAREEKVLERFDKLRSALDRLGYDVDALRAQLTGIEVYLKNPDRKKLSKKDREAVDRMRGELAMELDSMEKQRGGLRQELAVVRQQVGMGDVVVKLERDLRGKLRVMQLDQQQFLSGVGGGNGTVQQVIGMRKQLPPIEARLKGYYAKMNEVLDAKLVDFRKRVDAERELLGIRRAEIEQIRSASQGVTGEVVHRFFLESYKEIDDVVLRADVGRTDVLFQRKEDQSREIDQLFENRTTELKLLEENFEQVR